MLCVYIYTYIYNDIIYIYRERDGEREGYKVRCTLVSVIIEHIMAITVSMMMIIYIIYNMGIYNMYTASSVCPVCI